MRSMPISIMLHTSAVSEKQLHVDAGHIHLADAQRAEIIKPLDDVGTRAGTRTELLDLRVLVMFFERDDVGFLCHFYPPSDDSAPALLVVSTPGSASFS